MKRLLLSVIAAAPAALALLPCGTALAFTPPPIRHVFVVVEENESASTTFGATSAAPYLSRTLVSEGAFLRAYYGIGHNSLDNYIAMVSGQAPNPLTSGDCGSYVDFPAPTSMNTAGQENGEGCVYPANVPTVMSQLTAAHLTWRAYEDGMGDDLARDNPGSPTDPDCGHPIIGTADQTETEAPTDQYATKHDPFMYFHSVIDDQTACDADVVPLTQLATDLKSAATTPNDVFITPGLCDDGHNVGCDNGQPGGLPQIDTFLKTLVPEITSSPAYQQGGLLLITFDEAEEVGNVLDATACCGETPGPFEAANGIMPGGSGPGGGVVGAVLLSPFIAPGTVSTVPYNHYSQLGSIEALFGLAPIGEAVGAPVFGSDVYTRPFGTPTSAKAEVTAELASDVVVPKSVTPATMRHGGESIPFTAPEPGKLVLSWSYVKRGHKALAAVVAWVSVTFHHPGTRTVTLTLTAAGKTLVKAHHRLSLSAGAVFVPSGGGQILNQKSFVFG